ncbi:lamin tail domain-containing protein [Nannocystaceae bacterium ST9]
MTTPRSLLVRPTWPVLLAALLPLGCPADETEADDDVGPGMLPGDLVITEIMADPEGSDDGLEWFEIHNPTSEAIDLAGVELIVSKPDGTSRKAHAIARSLTIEPGDYLVVGSVLDEIATQSDADHLDYGYADALGDFAGSGGYLALELGEDVIDEVYYVEASSGASRAFDGAFSPDAVANDDLARWCDSRTEFDGPDFLATPGAANDLCTQSGCLEDGVSRPVVAAGPGDFVITEVHANPDIVDDALGEWFEIHALADFDLNGLEIGKLIGDPADEAILVPECLPVTIGDFVVFARSSDPLINGGVPAEAIRWVTGISFKNTDGSLWIGAPGSEGVPGELIDAVTWTTTPTGATTQLDPDYEDPAANDELGNWCPATAVYGDGDRGSPGGANEECAIVPPAGTCIDPDTRELRDIEPIPVGDLVITEFLANPEAVEDGAGEWFELLAKTSGDLNELWVGKAGEFTDPILSETCIEAAAGDYLVLAHDADPLVNGGLTEVAAIFDLALNNSNSDLIVGYEVMPGTIAVWDEITWTSTMPGLSNGFGGDLNTIANDDLMLWCPGEPSTPGEPNPSCGGAPSGMCLDLDTNQMRPVVAPALGDVSLSEIMPNPDAVADADGEWFELHTTAGFDLNGLEIGKNGAVEFTVADPNCLEVAADTWIALAPVGDPLTNGGVDPVTIVYAGLSLTNAPGNLFVGYAGTLLDEYTWASSPTGASLSRDLMADTWCAAVDPYGAGDLGTPALANPACGGGMMGDTCFDTVMGVDRAIVVPVIGDLVISEFMANPNAVADASGEWFELRALTDVDLNGLELGNAQFMDGLAPDLTLASPDCLAVAAGETLLFARNGDPLVNGGLPAVDFEFSFGLTNGAAFLYIGQAGALLDEIGWTATATGASTSLDPDAYDPAANDLANNGATWCYQTGVYGLGDKGTPDADNGQCG